MRGDTTQWVFPQFIKKKKQINPLAGGRQSGLTRAWQYTALLDIWERNIRECKNFPRGGPLFGTIIMREDFPP
ncbi:hypothetical protein, partial [Candidatus Avelusimicrobium alvi]|uniref:hypothetical protein n=1 Tax=Candidatus Avelusimicrobium alvi TaxID=3416221 RepID=UPI003D126865